MAILRFLPSMAFTRRLTLTPFRLWIVYMVGLLGLSGLIMAAICIPSLSQPQTYQAPERGTPSEITLSAKVVSVDPVGRTITMDWFPALYGTVLNCTELTTRPLVREVYMPSVLMDRASPTWRQEAPEVPVFVYNSDQLCPIWLWPSVLSFRTVTKLYSVSTSKKWDSYVASRAAPYPEDRYIAPIDFTVRNPQTGSLSTPTVFNLTSSSHGYEFTYTVLVNPGLRSGDERLQLTMSIARSPSTKVVAYTTLALSWLMTLPLLAILGLSLLRPSSWKVGHIELAAPIGILLLLVTTRNNLLAGHETLENVLDTFCFFPILILLFLLVRTSPGTIIFPYRIIAVLHRPSLHS
ncbi:hypothetical protein CC2G_008067 [Coprinopsis cinerea AmutBmut pab1-1]|nr:hypothetical protein CC2G_008067 [Coprinopsis cinerea AmutBmut pab1-1]